MKEWLTRFKFEYINIPPKNRPVIFFLGDPILGKQESCYNDVNGLLTGPTANLSYDNNIQNCISHCIELGYAYAGLKNS